MMDFEMLVKKKEQGLRHSLYGYNINEVDNFLDELLIIIKNQNREKEVLETEIEKLKEHEKVISSALVTAEKSALAVIEEAQKTSNAVLADADKKAHDVLEEANNKAHAVLEEADKKAQALIDNASLQAQSIIDKARQEEQRICLLAEEEYAKLKTQAETNKRIFGSLVSSISQQGLTAYDRILMQSQKYFDLMKEDFYQEISQLRQNVKGELEKLTADNT